MSRPPFLDEDDFPVAAVGSLIMSPNRIEPLATAITPAVAVQLSTAINRMARDERPRIVMDAWLMIH